MGKSRTAALVNPNNRIMARYLSLRRTEASTWPSDALKHSYETMLMRTLALPATPAKHANVLQHIMGYFKTILTADEKVELNEVIDNYRLGLVPLIVPITLLGHYTRKYDVAYLKDQAYLTPHPIELKLRNHA